MLGRMPEAGTAPQSFMPHKRMSGTLCWRGVQDAEAAFAEPGKDLTEVVEACVESTHAPILHRGAGACPPAGAVHAQRRASADKVLGRHAGQQVVLE